MEFLAFALSRLPDPYAILLGGIIGLAARRWWQTVLVGVGGGTLMALSFAFFGGISPDAPAYFVVDAMVVTLWASLVFALRDLLRRRKLASPLSIRPPCPAKLTG